jgi:maltooligosyltrehalose trehalohydrolase
MLSFYQELIRLRKDLPALESLSKEDMEVWGLEKTKILLIRRWWKHEEVVLVFNFAHEQRSALLPMPPGRWLKQLDSADKRWYGPGSTAPAELEADGEVSLTLPPESLVLYGQRCKP